MIRSALKLAPLALILALVALVPPRTGAGPKAREVVVLAVHDGDTLRCVDVNGVAESVRLLAVDAPELRQGRPGLAARDWLAAHARVGDTVRLVADSHHPADVYGRTLAYLFDRDMTCLNTAEVRAGRAFAYKPRGRLDRWDEAVAAEGEARLARRGVWAAKGEPTKPWDWRREHRKAAR